MESGSDQHFYQSHDYLYVKRIAFSVEPPGPHLSGVFQCLLAHYFGFWPVNTIVVHSGQKSCKKQLYATRPAPDGRQKS